MDPFYAQQQHQLFAEQQRQQQQQFQQQLHNENEYANYYGGSQHAMSPAFSNQQSPNAAYLPYDTQSLDDTVSQSAPSQGGYINEYGEEIMFEEPDPWRELAEWYWNLYNDHAGLLDPSAAIERGREDSFDSNESVTTANTEARERGPRLPPKLFRDQLINLYFVHVHPLCPIFDEYELCQAYEDSEDGMSILQKVTLLEFQAMLFAGALVSIHNADL